MVNPWLLKLTPYAAALVLAGLWQCSERAKGAAEARVAYLSDSLKARQAEGRRVDSVFKVDTVRLTRRLTTTQTLIDTLLRSDTVTLTRRESVLVFVADSLVTQCRQTITSCTARVGNLQEQLSLTTQQRDAYRKLIPGSFSKARSSLTAALVGAAITYLVLRP